MALFRRIGAVGAAMGVTKLPPIPAEAQGWQDRDDQLTHLSAEHFRIRRQPIQWPNGARIAVTWTVDYEDYSDNADSYEIHYHA